MSSLISARFPALPAAGECEGKTGGTESPGVQTTDEDLLACIANGKQQAWALGLLFQRYARIVRGIAARILRDSTEAEDLTQDFFLFIQRRCAILDSTKSSARSWIIQMAYHRAIERRRHLVSRRFYSRLEIENTTSQMVGTPTAECDYSADAVFGRNGLTKVLNSLSEHQRETLRLHFFDGYSLAEISQKSGQPLGNVRHHYYRGLDKLRKQMFGNTVSLDKPHAK